MRRTRFDEATSNLGSLTEHVLERGQLVETGTQTELLARGGLTWREQSEVAEAVTPP